jgi:hypothetical protein
MALAFVVKVGVWGEVCQKMANRGLGLHLMRANPPKKPYPLG